MVDTTKGERPNRVHIDLTPLEGIDRAIEEIVRLGGSVKKPPSLYPRPGSHGDELPRIDWAVMQDPFGNEFCLVSELSAAEIEAVRAPNGGGGFHRSRMAGGGGANDLSLAAPSGVSPTRVDQSSARGEGGFSIRRAEPLADLGTSVPSWQCPT